MRRTTRRDFLRYLSSVGFASWGMASGHTLDASSFLRSPTADEKRSELERRVQGMLLGSLIGDALGGPVEFKKPQEVSKVLPGARHWPENKKLDDATLTQLGESLKLQSYATLRPGTEPYAQWTPMSAAGTVTDDSRHKMILIGALRDAAGNRALPLTSTALAQAYLAYPDSDMVRHHQGYSALAHEWLKEYNQAARWVVGGRGNDALPPSRLWGGIATNAGQMALLPLAALFPGKPELAYRAAFSLGFMDNGTGKDFNSAIVAGLAQALVTHHDDKAPERSWQSIFAAMRKTDPYRYAQVPWVQRSVNRWLDFANHAANQAEQRPARLYDILEKQGEVKVWWEAHFTALSAIAILHLCQYQPLAALHLALDFGHDTDSAAQLLGAFVGALHGPDVFPASMRDQVATRLKQDYGESVTEWVRLLTKLSSAESEQKIIQFLR